MDQINIEVAEDPAACRATEDIQRQAWGMADRGIVPAEHIRAAVHNGGLLLLASAGGEPIGFCYGFVGRRDNQAILCSHMLAVVPGLRSSGVGRALKLAQREHAAARGFASIEWTFDPLQARNAYLNLRRLGAHARTYLIDHYGAMEDELNAGLPTDRLVAEWPLGAAGAEDIGHGGVHAEAGAGDSGHADERWLLRPTDTGTASAPRDSASTDGRAPLVDVRPGEIDIEAAGASRALIAVPTDIDRLRRSDRQAGTAWRHALRSAFTAAFDHGNVAVDLRRDVSPGCHAYVLEQR